MQVTGPANWANLAVAEKSRARHRAEDLRERRGVVIWHSEKTLPAPIAGKNERGERNAAFHSIGPRQFEQIGMSGNLVP